MPKSTHFTYLISISRYFVNSVSLSYRNWKNYIEAALVWSAQFNRQRL